MPHDSADRAAREAATGWLGTGRPHCWSRMWKSRQAKSGYPIRKNLSKLRLNDPSFGPHASQRTPPKYSGQVNRYKPSGDHRPYVDYLYIPQQFCLSVPPYPSRQQTLSNRQRLCRYTGRLWREDDFLQSEKYAPDAFRPCIQLDMRSVCLSCVHAFRCKLTRQDLGLIRSPLQRRRLMRTPPCYQDELRLSIG